MIRILPRTAALAALLVSAPTWAAATDPAWRVWGDPTELARYRNNVTVVERSSVSPDPCVYGGDGNLLPVAGANACRFDHLWEWAGRNRFLRRDGTERVLLDERGAGALMRIWMTAGQGVSAAFDPQVRVRVRLDQDPIPFLDVAVSDLFDGVNAPFLWPLAGDRDSGVGAGFAYVPILFRERLQISLELPNLEPASDSLPTWYQFHIQRSASAAADAPGFPADIGDWRSFVDQPAGQYPWPGSLTWQSGDTLVPANSETDLLQLTGGGTLLSLRLRPDQIAQWQQLVLVVAADGDTTIEQPLLELFGAENGPDDAIQSVLLGIGPDGFGYLHLPMPFRQSLRVRLRNDGDTSVLVSHAHAVDTVLPARDALRLRAYGHDSCIDGSRLLPDLTLLDLTGRGRWVGLLSRQQNLPGSDGVGGTSNYLEGDERVYLDGSPNPQWQGTGNEDFYNGGFYFDHGGTAGFAHRFALHGAPWHDTSGGMPAASRLYRLLLTDALPFHRRLQVRLERGAYGNQPMCARGIALVYHEPEPGLKMVASLDLSSAASILAAQYSPPPDAECGDQSGAFADEPPTALAARVCRFTSAGSTFRFVLARPARQLWLRRRFDGSEGGQAAIIEVNGQIAGAASDAMGQPNRPWQDVDLPLDLPPQPAGTALQFRILPTDNGAPFTEAAYWLMADTTDDVFLGGFE